jgi:ABC-2 type transport system permease protein
VSVPADGSLALYGRLIGARCRADLTYRMSFVLRVVSAALVTALDYVGILALVSKVGTIGGWDRWQVTFLYGASSVAFRLADSFVGGPVERCSQFVRLGTFDTFLVRPRSALLQVLGADFALRRVGQLLAMMPFLVVALTHLEIDWSVGKVLFLVAQIVGASLLFTSIFVIVSCLAFWSPESREIASAFTYGGATVAEYPVHAMASWIRSLTYTLVPVAFTAYFPAFVLFDAPNPLGVPRWLSYVSPMACIPFGVLAIFVWRFAVRHYRSTGS